MGNEMYADKTVVWQPGKSILGKSGQKLIVIIPTPRCVVDSHMHIENGACTPLPLLWDKNGLIRGWKRKTIDFLGEKAGAYHRSGRRREAAGDEYCIYCRLRSSRQRFDVFPGRADKVK